MTIADSKFAAELVNTKGKAFKYDAIECLVRDEESSKKMSGKYVCLYLEPGKFMHADSAFFLISKDLPSPMGAYLSAYSTKEDAEQIQAQKGGSIYLYPDLKGILKK